MGRPRKYPLELRERSVRLAIESGRPIARVAADLGVHPETLRVWVRQAQADAGERADRLTSAEREEMCPDSPTPPRLLHGPSRRRRPSQEGHRRRPHLAAAIVAEQGGPARSGRQALIDLP